MSTVRDDLQSAIDVLRELLNQQSEKLALLSADEMLELSRSLDELIVSYYRSA